MIDASRGVVLRGAGWEELRTPFLVLCGMAVLVLAATALRFPRARG
jgi:hypothetical protein